MEQQKVDNNQQTDAKIDKELELLKTYINTELSRDVLLFNTLIGNAENLDNPEILAQRINKQIKIVAEELYTEYFVYYSSDHTEELDAIGDVLFTASYLVYLIKKVDDLDEVDAEVLDSDINEGQLDMLSSALELFYNTFLDHFDSDLIIKACKRIVKNNTDKFTTDEVEFNTWKSPDGEELKKHSVVVNGVTYYSLINSIGKVRKRVGFPVVDLSDLVDTMIQRDNVENTERLKELGVLGNGDVGDDGE